jgi:hypothetical protein
VGFITFVALRLYPVATAIAVALYCLDQLNLIIIPLITASWPTFTLAAAYTPLVAL